MPTYQYACKECGHRFEAVQAFSDASLTDCPSCGGALRKVFNSVGVVFKGSGFYRNDSRPAGKDDSAAADSSKGDGGGKDSGKKDEKSDSGTKAAPAAKDSSSGSSSSDSSSSSSSSSSSTSKAAPVKHTPATSGATRP